MSWSGTLHGREQFGVLLSTHWMVAGRVHLALPLNSCVQHILFSCHLRTSAHTQPRWWLVAAMAPPRRVRGVQYLNLAGAIRKQPPVCPSSSVRPFSGDVTLT